MARIAVTGVHGQIAHALATLSTPEMGIYSIGRPNLDLAAPESVHHALADAEPDLIINAAAYTKVDLAETEREAAFAINEAGARAVARSAATLGVPLLHVSTDYVFDGAQSTPYREADAPHPINVYGASKLAGERAVFAETDDCIVVRLSGVYSAHGANFVRTMLNLARTRDEVRVVSDQRTRPTCATDIAPALIHMARALVERPNDAELRGVFHLCAAGDASWAEFADAIFAASRQHAGPSARVRPVSTAEFGARAARPAHALLDAAKAERVFGIRLPAWDDSLPRCVAQILDAA